MLRLVYSSTEARRKQSLDDEALNWVVSLTSGETTESDREAFRAWRDQSREHTDALARARTLWTQVGQVLPRVGRPRPRRALRNTVLSLSTAASLLLCLGVGQEYSAIGRFDQATVRGERRTVRLPDGSRVTMAGDTALDVRFEKGLRRVDLSRGEALFEVRHDIRQPFVIHTDESVVRDVGTVFDVQRRDSRTHLTVVEGLVEASKDDRRTLLRANQAMSFSADVQGRVETVDALRATAWVRGRLVVQDQTLSEIVAALKPHYSGRIYIANDAVGQRRLSAVVDLARIDDWLAGLAKVQSVSLNRIGNLVVLS